MLDKILKILLIGLFFLLPIINSHLFDLFGIKWGFYVEGNYEFTKVMFFNIFSGIILSLFFILTIFRITPPSVTPFKKGRKLYIPKIIFPLIFILFLSTIFSSHPFISLLGNTSKGDSLLMFLNLIGLFIVFINLNKDFQKKLIFTTIISSIVVGIIGIKEYFFPTFDYGNLSNRAISTFGHPNYLALYILVIMPFLIKKLVNKLYLLIFIILIFLLILTKSIWGIFIFIIYIIIPLSCPKGSLRRNSYSPFWRKRLQFLIPIIGIIVLIFLIYNFGLLTKLNSFFSRYYIWQSTINIIFSDLKHIFIGGGLGSLDLVFDGFKAKELYIFENIGFTADNPHNLLLNFFYNFGIGGLVFIIYSIYKLIKKYKNTVYFHSIILFLIFTIFNFASISHYLIIILIISIIYKNKSNNNKKNKNIIINFIKKFLSIILITILLIISICGSYISYYNYKSEYYKYTKNNYIEKNFLIDLRENEIGKYIGKHMTSASEYLYYGNLYRESGNKKIAILNYNKGLELIPDMRDKDSKYYDNYLIKKLFIPERFYSEKFSNLKEILERVNIKSYTEINN